MQSCLWYNNQLSDATLFIDKWFKSGINLVGDIVDSNGVVIVLVLFIDIEIFIDSRYICRYQ